MRNLTLKDLFGLMVLDSGGRWHAINPVCVEYCARYREPSRAWPNSHSRPLLTKEFAAWCEINYPEFAANYPDAVKEE